VTLLDIKRKRGLSTNATAAIEPGLVYCMEQRGTLSIQVLEKILGGISRVIGQKETVGATWVKVEKRV
jgi:hypothetical protein